MSEWPEVSVDHIAADSRNAIAMGPFGSRIKTEFFVDKGVPVIRGGNLSQGRFLAEGFVFVTDAKADELSSAAAFPGDIVFTHRGTIGQVGLIPENGPFPRYIVSQSQMKLTCNTEIAEPAFVFYFFRSPAGQHQILASASTTGVPAISRPSTSLRQFRLPLPDIRTQRRIAHILGTLDDKIELNRRMNRTLEAIAQAIFKSWFIDFDPVHAKAEGREPVGMDPETAALFPDSFQDSPLGRIPKGWQVRVLSEVAEVVDCLHSRKPEVSGEGDFLLQVYNIGEHGKLDLSDPYRIRDEDYQEWTRRMELLPGDLVITKTGRVGAVGQIPPGIKAALGRNMVGIRACKGVTTPRYLRCVLLSGWMQREVDRLTSDGTILRSLHVKAIEQLRLVLPPWSVLERFERAADRVLLQADANTEETRTLEGMRDGLLPELMSGRLDLLVTGADIEDN